MFDSINHIGINDKIEQIVTKTEDVSSKLQSILHKTKFAKNNNPLEKMTKKEFKSWAKDVKKMNSGDTNYLQ